jgi:hypothetical protein
MESYFINERHIHQLYNAITETRILELIETARLSHKETSLSKIEEHLRQTTDKPAREIIKDADKMYSENEKRYCYGKDVLYELHTLIASELNLPREDINLIQNTKHINITELKKVAGIIVWD